MTHTPIIFFGVNYNPKIIKPETLLQAGAESIIIINNQIIELRKMRDSTQNPLSSLQ